MGEYDDSYAVLKAVNEQGVIISNKPYNNVLGKLPPQLAGIFEDYIRKHRLSFAFEMDQFVPKPSIDFEGAKYRENI